MKIFHHIMFKHIFGCLLFGTTNLTGISPMANETGGGTARETRMLSYVNAWSSTAQEQMSLFRIPASITLAQGMLESGFGDGTLAREANNHFGIKCGGNWSGESFALKDDDRDAEGNLIKSCFRKYDSAEASFADHTDFLRTRKNYEFLFKLNPTDYEAWAYGLKSAGYATDAAYAEKLIRLIEENDLARFDREVFEKNQPIVQNEEPTTDEKFADERFARPVVTAFLMPPPPPAPRQPVLFRMHNPVFASIELR